MHKVMSNLLRTTAIFAVLSVSTSYSFGQGAPGAGAAPEKPSATAPAPSGPKAGMPEHGSGKAASPRAESPGGPSIGQPRDAQPRSRVQGDAQRPGDSRDMKGRVQRDEPRTKGRAQTDERDMKKGRAQMHERDKSANPRSGAIQDPNSGPKASVEKRHPGAVELQGEQRTRVRDAFMHIDRRNRVTNLDINISVGVVVPQRVVLRPLPPTIVSIVPAYRDYVYVEYGNEILIIDPQTREIVYVIELSA